MTDSESAGRRGPVSPAEGPLSFAVFQLARAHRGRAAAMLRAMNLHPGQELLLMQLFDRDAQTQSELLESVGLDHSTISKSVRRMQEAGLLTSERSPDDRRVVIVRLTDKGRAMCEPISEMWAALEAESTRGLNAHEIEAFIAIAGTITNAVGDRDVHGADRA